MTGVVLPPFFDAHVHFRTGAMLRAVVPWTAAYCGEAVVMPNVPAVDTAEKVCSYRHEVLAAAPPAPATAACPGFEPLMTMKLTRRTTADDVARAHSAGAVALKVYPQGATTASHDGVTDLLALAPALGAAADLGLVLCVHGEMPGAYVLDREAAYLFTVRRVLREHPALRVVLEHVTTREAANFVGDGPDRLAATVTAHHLFLTLDDVIGSGLRPHHFCYPVPKHPADRLHLRHFALHHPRFFLGSDSAPHLKADKESACGCAGVFSAPVVPSVLAEFFLGGPRGDPHPPAVAALEQFACRRGPAFYGRRVVPGEIVIRRGDVLVPEVDARSGVVPFRAGTRLAWEWSRAGQTLVTPTVR